MLRLALIALLVPGCIPSPSTEQLRTRAAFDLQCPEDQLQVIELDQRTRGIVGCGRRGTYLYICGNTCDWISDTSAGVPLTGRAPAASAAPAAPAASSVYIPSPPPPKPAGHPDYL